MKKDKTRFTIRFNPVDPRQLKTMNALEAAGRRKSTLIADAVCEYLARRGEKNETFIPAISLTSVSIPVPHKETVSEVSHSATSEMVEGVEEIDADSVENAGLDEEICGAILDGLNAFEL